MGQLTEGRVVPLDDIYKSGYYAVMSHLEIVAGPYPTRERAEAEMEREIGHSLTEVGTEFQVVRIEILKRTNSVREPQE